MKLDYLGHRADELRSLNAGEEEVLEILEAPNAVLKYESAGGAHDREVYLAVKGDLGPNAGHDPIVVLLQTEGAGSHVHFAYRVPISLARLAGTLNPLSLLEALASGYGTPLRLGKSGRVSSFFQNELLPLGNEADAKIIQGGPDGNQVVASVFRRIQLPTGPHLEVCLAIGLNPDAFIGIRGALAFPPKPRVKMMINDPMKGHVTPHALLQASGTLAFLLQRQGRGGLLFEISAPTFYFSAALTHDQLILKRNECEVVCPLEPSRDGRRLIALTWAPSRLSAYNSGAEGNTGVGREVSTPPTLAPYEVLDWARRETLAPKDVYEDRPTFYDTIGRALDSIEEKVEDSAMYPAFWDEVRVGPKKVGMRPKREVDIHPTLEGLLWDVAVARGFTLIREPVAATGRLDFYFAAALRGGGMVGACMEVKLAHSGDLFHGLEAQLPAYMRAKRCEFGVYCVLWFRGASFDEPKGFDDARALYHQLNSRIPTFPTGIRVLVISVVPPAPPSSRGSRSGN